MSNLDWLLIFLDIWVNFYVIAFLIVSPASLLFFNVILIEVLKIFYAQLPVMFARSST